MADEGLAAETVCQVALVVKDIEKASKAWAEALGLPVPEASLTGPAEETGAVSRPADGGAGPTCLLQSRPDYD